VIQAGLANFFSAGRRGSLGLQIPKGCRFKMKDMTWWQSVEDSRAIGELPSVSDLTHDSRLVTPGSAFAAVPGRQADGHQYLDAAVHAGAIACVVQEDHADVWSAFIGRAPLLVVPDVRQALGKIAAAVHGEPSKQLRMVGVTGTDGKTTSTHLIAHVLSACGLRAGYLSSVGFEAGSGLELNASHMTTLEATLVQSMLARAVRAGLETMVLEASSEGLAQGRMEGCEIDVAVFTNLSRDHLDFHETMERYLEAKGLLFQMLDRPKQKPFPRAAIVNADHEASSYLRGITTAPVLSYGSSEVADFRALDVDAEGFGLRFSLEHASERYSADVPLTGRFNVDNSLAAVAVASSQGIEPARAVAALAGFPGVPGRLERIDEGQPFRVFVDIASTPAALENVLHALRPATRGLLWVVFGAAGGRDPARRTGMGAVASRLADRSVLTNEDPRHEDPDAIIDAIASSLREAGRREPQDFVRLPDRREAISYAFEHARPGDTVLLAGKATEPTMLFADGQRPWDERAVARELLRGRAG
jgi:UDP-N-acetylmuramoyl-L-alanyl-D-glutamate--2,6-diaminopimelate ligase